MLQFRAQRPGKQRRQPKAFHPRNTGGSSAILQLSARELERMPQSVELTIRLPPVKLPAMFRAPWAVQAVHALFGGLRGAWRWIELCRQRPQKDNPNSDARQGCSAPDDGSEGGPTLSPCKQVKEETSSSTLLKTALDYLVKEQQLAESGADSNKIKTEEPHTQQGLEGLDLASRADSIAVQFESQISIKTEQSPNHQELGRRREIVRQFFNDFWSSTDDKPATFAVRLSRAEGYINERLAACGEAWRLDPAIRKQLGLPP